MTVVALSELILTQTQLDTATLIGAGDHSVCGDPVPHVVEWRGEWYVEDGHHRLVRRWIRGDQVASVRILDMKNREVDHGLR